MGGDHHGRFAAVGLDRGECGLGIEAAKDHRRDAGG